MTHADQPENYKITAQIYNTGIVQLIFSYTSDPAKNIERQKIVTKSDKSKQLEDQLVIVQKYFNYVRSFLTAKFVKMFEDKLDIFNDKEITEKSDMIFNTVPGVMPYAKKKHLYAGYIVDFFDDTNEKWEDNYGWSGKDERGYIVEVVKKRNKPNVYRVVKGKPDGS